jgi:hypothetical protein
MCQAPRQGNRQAKDWFPLARGRMAQADNEKPRDDECGRYDLAGKSVAVPFVGMTAAALVVAELLRILHDGPAYANLKLRLETPAKLFAQTTHKRPSMN